MNTDIHSETANDHQAEAAKENAQRSADAAKESAKRATTAVKDATGVVVGCAADITHATQDAARRAGHTAKDIYHAAAVKGEETLATSKEYVRQNPVPVVLGAIAFGAALGCMIMMARRKPTFGERYADEPMTAVREAIFGALAPMTHRVHQGYDSARDGAGKAMDRLHRIGSEYNGHSLSNRIGRTCNNLKFW